MRQLIAALAFWGVVPVASALPVEWSPVVNGVIEVDVNTGAIVQLRTAGAGPVGGMDLFITVPAEVVLSEGRVRGFRGSLWELTKPAGEAIDFSDVSDGHRHGQIYVFANNTINATAGLILAKFRVTVPTDTPVGTRFWMENTWDGATSALGGDMPVVGVNLLVTPEPASLGLLAIGSLWAATVRGRRRLP